MPDAEFPGGRGMDAETRERIKKKILQAAIDNGEVQIDVTPIPDKLPATEFNQGKLLDSLFEDQLELIKFANDETPLTRLVARVPRLCWRRSTSVSTG